MLARHPAGTALRDPKHHDEQIDCSPPFGAQKLPRDNSLSMSTSRACLATSFLSRAFYFSSSLSRFTSSAFIPPY